jgi:tripartite-type tricarboxylate transporter receptor subunit TctC
MAHAGAQRSGASVGAAFGRRATATLSLRQLPRPKKEWEKRMTRIEARTWATGILLAAGCCCSHAGSVSDFYAGKTITLEIGDGEGGGTDVSGRLIAAYLGRQIPGNPKVIPANMPGASGLRAAEFLSDAATRDGLTLGFIEPYVIVQKATDPSLKFDPGKLAWIGRISTQTTFGIVWRTAPAQTIDQARDHKDFLTANGATGTAAMVPWALNRIAGTQFQVVLGYPSAAASAIALERGEANGNGSATADFLETKRDWLQQKKISFLYTIGYKRTARAPDAPTIVELARNDVDKKAMELLASSSIIGRVLFAPPDVPHDRQEALQEAFRKLVKDPDFLATAKKLNIELDPLDGDNLAKRVNDIFSFSPEVVARMKGLTSKPR